MQLYLQRRDWNSFHHGPPYNNSNYVAYNTEYLGQFRHNFNNDMAKWNISYNINYPSTHPSIYPPFI